MPRKGAVEEGEYEEISRGKAEHHEPPRLPGPESGRGSGDREQSAHESDPARRERSQDFERGVRVARPVVAEVPLDAARGVQKVHEGVWARDGKSGESRQKPRESPSTAPPGPVRQQYRDRIGNDGECARVLHRSRQTHGDSGQKVARWCRRFLKSKRRENREGGEEAEHQIGVDDRGLAEREGRKRRQGRRQAGAPGRKEQETAGENDGGRRGSGGERDTPSFEIELGAGSLRHRAAVDEQTQLHRNSLQIEMETRVAGMPRIEVLPLDHLEHVLDDLPLVGTDVVLDVVRGDGPAEEKGGRDDETGEDRRPA